MSSKQVALKTNLTRSKLRGKKKSVSEKNTSYLAGGFGISKTPEFCLPDLSRIWIITKRGWKFVLLWKI